MAIKYILFLVVETPREFITTKLSTRKTGSSSELKICDLFNSHALLSQSRYIYRVITSVSTIFVRVLGKLLDACIPLDDGSL